VPNVFIHITKHDNPIPAKQKAATISTLLTETAFSQSQRIRRHTSRQPPEHLLMSNNEGLIITP
jgi:hypothetical protein